MIIIETSSFQQEQPSLQIFCPILSPLSETVPNFLSSAILQDCPQPDIFWPERYLNDPNLLDPLTVIFGFGRR